MRQNNSLFIFLAIRQAAILLVKTESKGAQERRLQPGLLPQPFPYHEYGLFFLLQPSYFWMYNTSLHSTNSFISL